AMEMESRLHTARSCQAGPDWECPWEDSSPYKRQCPTHPLAYSEPDFDLHPEAARRRNLNCRDTWASSCRNQATWQYPARCNRRYFQKYYLLSCRRRRWFPHKPSTKNPAPLLDPSRWTRRTRNAYRTSHQNCRELRDRCRAWSKF